MIKSVLIAAGPVRGASEPAATSDDSSPDASGVVIARASREDAGEILTLQRAAFLADAQLYGDPFLPSLTQSVDEIADLIDDPSVIVLVARLRHRLVGSVRADLDDTTAHIGRLMTAPDLQGLGIGRRLMESIEAAADRDLLELSTGSLSTSNLAFYGRLGYTTNTETVNMATTTSAGSWSVVTMSKSTASKSSTSKSRARHRPRAS